MPPAARILLEVETIRDGGSLAAGFLDERGSKWILFLKIDLADHGSEIERRGFKDPMLIDADPAKRPANTKNRIYSELSGPAHPLTWEEAQALVAQIADLPADLTEWGRSALDHLRKAIDGKGELPPGMERRLPVRRP